MGDQIIQLPADSTGKKLRTQERTVGANTVQMEYVIPDSLRVMSGVYLAHFKGTVQAAATNGTSTGFWWFYNPVGSSKKIALRFMRVSISESTPLTSATSPRVSFTAFTFTGTPGGTAITPRKVDTSFATATGLLMSTQVTSVVTLTQAFHSVLVPCIQSGSSGASDVMVSEWSWREDEQPVLAAGEGIVCYQPDAGTTADTRTLVTDFAWAEYTIP